MWSGRSPSFLRGDSTGTTPNLFQSLVTVVISDQPQLQRLRHSIDESSKFPSITTDRSAHPEEQGDTISATLRGVRHQKTSRPSQRKVNLVTSKVSMTSSSTDAHGRPQNHFVIIYTSGHLRHTSEHFFHVYIYIQEVYKNRLKNNSEMFMIGNVCVCFSFSRLFSLHPFCQLSTFSSFSDSFSLPHLLWTHSNHASSSSSTTQHLTLPSFSSFLPMNCHSHFPWV